MHFRRLEFRRLVYVASPDIRYYFVRITGAPWSSRILEAISGDRHISGFGDRSLIGRYRIVFGWVSYLIASISPDPPTQNLFPEVKCG